MGDIVSRATVDSGPEPDFRLCPMCWPGWYGGGHWGHGGHWGRFANLTPEQAGKVFDLRQKFLDDTAGLRKDMMVKRAELRALWRVEKPDEQQILAKLKELNGVREKFQEKMVPFRLAMKQLLPKRPEHKKMSLEDEDYDLAMAMEPDGSWDIGL
jgi:Spy/CpxP family protein refolding chaperone